MANKTLIGNVAPVADVWTYTVVTFTSTTVHGITCNGKTISITLGSGETATTAASKLLALLVAMTAGEFQEYTWTAVAAVITGVAKIAGIPGTFTNASTGGTAGTLANSAPAVGPNFISLAGNWSGAALPVSGDRFILDRNSPDALHGLDWLTAGTPVVPSEILLDNFPGVVGLPPVRGSSDSFSPTQGASYPEYRKQFLELPAGTITVNIGQGEELPQRVHLQLAGSGTTVNVVGAREPADGQRATVVIKGTTSHPRLSVSQGTVAVAPEIGQTGGFDDVLIGDEGNSNADAFVLFGEGATVPLVHNQSGRSESDATITSLVMGLGATEHRQTEGDLTAVVRGGTLIFASDGTLLVDASGAGVTVDLSKDPRPKTLDDASTILAGARLLDPGDTRDSGSGATFDHTSLPISKLGPSVLIVKP